jgi:hypothetical protein
MTRLQKHFLGVGAYIGSDDARELVSIELIVNDLFYQYLFHSSSLSSHASDTAIKFLLAHDTPTRFAA